ncbi:sugar transferase [Halomonas sp. LR5S13]|uniref:sugar transferase n=1 Tax=Halomonas rhizosphaerae TaxID=3043296 RepID=UPI0024A9EF87|nr:sugar transferase [Halomonas rhizosphaerae]MDI5920850.1 sugar transferase [Halomonas rhizosphaerae]
MLDNERQHAHVFGTCDPLQSAGMTRSQKIVKRLFDIVLSLVGLLAVSWLISVCYIVASIDTRSSGIFSQKRIGLGGRIFTLYKIRTMRPNEYLNTNVTTINDPRITKIGRFMRRTKLDELPQLWNVLIGDMSFVGPRPDVPGFADLLHGDASLILSVRPGITGPASLAFRDEELLLAVQEDPESYNRDIVYPLKVEMNIHYVRSWSFRTDIKCIWHTLFG